MKSCPLITGSLGPTGMKGTIIGPHAIKLHRSRGAKLETDASSFQDLPHTPSKSSARPKRNQNLSFSSHNIHPHGLSIIRRIGRATITFGAEDVERFSIYYKACTTESTSHLTSYTSTVISKHVNLSNTSNINIFSYHLNITLNSEVL